VTNFEAELNPVDVRDVIRRALIEDLGGGLDVTSVSTISHAQRSTGAFVTRQGGVICGLPLVEAMTLGTPVIASDIPIFREVGGKAASYVDPGSAAGFAAAVMKLRDDEHWQEVSRLSVARAREFSWDESARQLVEVAHDIVGMRSRSRRSRR